MSVMIDTSLGEVVVDLFCEEAPLAAKNFLKLCKIKYYNGCLFYNVQQNFMIQTGDPTATGKGGTSAYGLMYGEQARFFEDEFSATSRKHNEAGLLSMANMGVPNSNGSQFFFSMRGDDMQHLDGKHTVFAKVMEGMDTLEQINEQFCDEDGRPYRDIRILHTYILDDPFDDPPQLVVPDESPLRDRPEEEKVVLRLGALDKVSLEADERTELEREKQLREKTARSNAVVLEMIGDLPDADTKPPENVLFVCKLNPVTTDDDLEIIFTRFGTCRAEICRDHITGDSLNYAFVEFEAIESCEEAFKKMNNVLIDDRRIRVDFSQSVAREWSTYKGRAQGGQKLASGRGGKATQQQPQANTKNGGYVQPVAGRERGKASAAGQERKSKWGNSPRGGVAPVAVPVPEKPPAESVGGRRGDDATSHRRGGKQYEEKLVGVGSRSSNSGTAGEGNSGGRKYDHRDSTGDLGKSRRMADRGGRRGGDNGSRDSRGDYADSERRQRRDGKVEQGSGWRRDDRDGDDRTSRASGARGGEDRRTEDERRDGPNGDRSKNNDSGRRGDHHRGRDGSRKEREGGDRDGGGRDERSKRKDRSRSRSREKDRRGGGSRDRSRRR